MELHSIPNTSIPNEYTYYQSGKLKTRKVYYLDRILCYHEFDENEELHGVSIFYYLAGNRGAHTISYMYHGKLHREDGPAFVSYCRDKSIILEMYYINDKAYSEEDYKYMIQLLIFQ